MTGSPSAGMVPTPAPPTPAWASRLNAWLRRLGVELRRYPHPTAAEERRAALLRHRAIDLVVDVGANGGQYAIQLRRRVGWSGRIVSFEPLSEAFERLQRSARGDARWELRRQALGDAAGAATLHVAANSESSSLLPMLPAHRDAAPHSAYVGGEPVEVVTLDAAMTGLLRGESRLWLKIDVQGYELHVLRGAAATLAQRVEVVELEMSLVPLYDGAPSMAGLQACLEAAGFRLAGLEPGFADPRSGELLQVDGLFVRDRDHAVGSDAG